MFHKTQHLTVVGHRVLIESFDPRRGLVTHKKLCRHSIPPFGDTYKTLFLSATIPSGVIFTGSALENLWVALGRCHPNLYFMSVFQPAAPRRRQNCFQLFLALARTAMKHSTDTNAADDGECKNAEHHHAYHVRFEKWNEMATYMKREM